MATLQSMLDPNLIYAAAWALIHSLWQSAMVALLLAAWLHFNQARSARVRYLVSCFALCACVSVLATSFWQLFNGAVSAQIDVVGVNLLETNGIWHQTYSALNPHLHTLVICWLVGFVIHALADLANIAYSWRLRVQAVPTANEWQVITDGLRNTLAIKQTVRLLESPAVSSLCTMGHWRPVILLPLGLLTQLPREQLEALLLHELAHIRRHDYLVNLLQSVFRHLLFFNPAVLWICRQIDQERENACDDIAITYCGNPKHFAAGLANIAEINLHQRAVLAARGRKNLLLARIQRLFTPAAGESRIAERLSAVCCAAGLAIAINVNAADIAPREAVPTPNASTTLTVATATAELPKPLLAKPLPTANEPAAVQPIAATQAAPVAAPQATIAVAEPRAVPPAAPVAETAARHYQHLQLAQAPMPKPEVAIKARAPTLSPVKVLEFNELMLAETFNLPLARKIAIEPVAVHFADIWLKRFQAKTSTSYQEQISRTYAAELTKSLQKAFRAEGWTVVDSKDSGAIHLQAALIDLYIFAPETPGIKQTIIAQAGQAGIRMALKAPDGATFMTLEDHRNTEDASSGPSVANRATNLHYFKKLMESWAGSAATYTEQVTALVEQQRK